MQKICFVIDDFELGSPAQQLLDRFLIGRQRDGEFMEPKDRRVSVKANRAGELLEKRKELGLTIADDVADSQAIVVLDESSVLRAVQWAQPGTRVFVYGRLAESMAAAKKIIGAANGHGIILAAGTETATALRVPEVKAYGRASEALVVVNGKFPTAELMGLDALLPMLPIPKAIRAVRSWRGAAVWEAGEKKNWSWALLRAALARSDSPLGNAVIDGRTEDIAGLGLVQKMANDPRGWMLETTDGAKLEILVLDGVLGDTVAAILANGRISSTQIFRAPSPAREDFSRLAATIDDFFATGKTTLGLERASWIVEALEEFAKARGM